MRKRKAPIAAVFFLALLIAVVGFFNMRSASSAPPGVFDPGIEEAHNHSQGAEAAPPSDAQRQGAMQEQLQGPLAPGAAQKSDTSAIR